MLILELFGWRCLLGIGVSSFIHKAVLGRLQTPADFIPCTAGHLPRALWRSISLYEGIVKETYLKKVCIYAAMLGE